MRQILGNFRLLASLVAAILMCVEPTAFAVSAGDQQILLGGLERSGLLNREISMDEYYKLIEPGLTSNDRANFEELLKYYPSFKMPKLTVSRIPGAHGGQDLQIQFARNHESGSMVIYASGDVFARMAGVNFTNADMQDPSRFVAKVKQAEKNIEGRKPASEEPLIQGQRYIPKSEAASTSAKRSQPLKMLSYADYQSLSQKGKIKYISMLRQLAADIEKAQNTRIYDASKSSKQNSKRKPASKRPADAEERKDGGALVPPDETTEYRANKPWQKWTALISEWESEALAVDNHNSVADLQDPTPNVAARYGHLTVPSGYVDPSWDRYHKCIVENEDFLGGNVPNARILCSKTYPNPSDKQILVNLIKKQNEESASVTQVDQPAIDARKLQTRLQIKAIKDYDDDEKNRASRFTEQEFNNLGIDPKLRAEVGREYEAAPGGHSVESPAAKPSAPSPKATVGEGSGQTGKVSDSRKRVASGTTQATNGNGNEPNPENTDPLKDQQNNFRGSRELSDSEKKSIDSLADPKNPANLGKSVGLNTKCLMAGYLTTYGCASGSGTNCTSFVCGGTGASWASGAPPASCSTAKGSAGIKCNPELYGDKSCIEPSAHSVFDCNTLSKPSDLVMHAKPGGIHGRAEWETMLTGMRTALAEQERFCVEKNGAQLGEWSKGYEDQHKNCGELQQRIQQFQNFDCPFGTGPTSDNFASKTLPDDFGGTFRKTNSYCEGGPSDAPPNNSGGVCEGYISSALYPITMGADVCKPGTRVPCPADKENNYYHCDCGEGTGVTEKSGNHEGVFIKCTAPKEKVATPERPGFFSRAFKWLRKNWFPIFALSSMAFLMWYTYHASQQALKYQYGLTSAPKVLATPVPSTGIGTGTTTTTPTVFPSTFPDYGGQRNGYGQ